jgi:O-antigen/teichoic acid export membrane protein
VLEIILILKEKWREKINQSNLLKGSLIIGSGTIISQLIQILSIPIITRLFDPNDFGVFGVYMSIFSMLLIFASLRYEYAIPIPDDENSASHLLILCLGLNFIFTGVLLIISYFIGEFTLSYFNLKNFLPFIWLLVLGVLFGGIYQSLNYWAIRTKDYTGISFANINQSISGNAVKIILGFLSFGTLSLIIGQVISQAAGIGTFVRSIFKYDLPKFHSISLKKIFYLAKNYLAFPIYTLPSSLIFVVTAEIPVLILTIMYGVTVVGWYVLAYQVLLAPATLIAGSLSQVYYAEIAEMMKTNPGGIKHVFLTTTKNLFYLGLPIFVIISLLAPFLFPIVFGENWINAGYYCIPLSLVVMSQFVMTPTSKLELYGRNSWRFYLEFLRILLVGISFGIALFFNVQPIIALTLYAVFLSLFYLISYYANIIAIDSIIFNEAQLD